MSGAVPPPTACPLERLAGVPQPVCPGCGRCGCGDPAPAPQRAPLRAGVARCGGGGGASPGGAAYHHCEGRLRSGAVPPPTARPLGRLLGSPPTCCGRRCVGVGAQHCPLGLHALWGLRAAGVVGGRPRGGVACHRCEGRLVSGAVPPPAARPLERAARVPRPVCPGCGRCGRGDPAPAPRRAPLRVGVSRRGGGGRASLGKLPSAVVRGVWGRAAGACWPRAVAAGVGVCGVCGVCAVCVWCAVPLFSCPSGAPLSGASVRCSARRVPACRPPCALPLLGCWLPPVSFVASLRFTLSSTLLPGMHFFPASALVRVSVFLLAGSSFSLVGPCETKEGLGYVGLRRLGAVIM